MPYPSNLPALTPRTPSTTNQFSTVRVPQTAERRPRFVAVTMRKTVTSVTALPVEPEDAHLTGATRSLTRRLLALSIRQAS